MQGHTQGLTNRGAVRPLARNLLMWLAIFQNCSSRIPPPAPMRSRCWVVVIETIGVARGVLRAAIASI